MIGSRKAMVTKGEVSIRAANANQTAEKRFGCTLAMWRKKINFPMILPPQLFAGKFLIILSANIYQIPSK